MVGLKVLCSAVTRSALSDAPVTALAAPRSPGGAAKGEGAPVPLTPDA